MAAETIVQDSPSLVTYSTWMVQVWENGGWSDYWPVTILGSSRRRAVERAPRVLCGRWASKRWRVGRKLKEWADVPPKGYAGGL